MTVIAHNTAQNRPDNFPSYPPGSHHCSNNVYLRKGGRWKELGAVINNERKSPTGLILCWSISLPRGKGQCTHWLQ